MGACAGSVATAVAFAIALAQFGRPSWRAAMFGSAAAIMFAFTAALIKQVTGDFHPTWYLFLTHWHVYAMVLTGLVAVFLTQNAYSRRSGHRIAGRPRHRRSSGVDGDRLGPLR